MQLLKQLATVLTLVAVLVLPFGVMGCANEAPPSGLTSDPAGATDADTESDLGEPESGTNL